MAKDTDKFNRAIRKMWEEYDLVSAAYTTDSWEYGRDGRIAEMAKTAKIKDMDFTQASLRDADFSEVRASRLWRDAEKSRDPTLIIPHLKNWIMTPVYYYQFVKKRGF